MRARPTVHLLVVERDGGPVYHAKWRHEGRQIKRRIGPRGSSAATRRPQAAERRAIRAGSSDVAARRMAS